MPADDILGLPPPPADARIHYGSDPLQFADLRIPQRNGPHPVVVNIHGGFWRNKYDLAHAGHLCAALTANGFVTWNLEYRRVGDPGGGWPGTFYDIRAGYRFLADLSKKASLDLNRVVVMGHSAGGQLALCLAAHEPSVRRVVSLAGVLDLRRAWELHLSTDAVAQFLGGSPEQVPERYHDANPLQLDISAEQWVFHGTDDDVVSPDVSRRYFEQKTKKGEKVHLREIENAGHFALIDPRSKAWTAVEQVVLG
jgi:acetyl esterase/lipase